MKCFMIFYEIVRPPSLFSIGVNSCFLNSYWPKLLYFHLHVLLLLLTNLVLFSTVIYKFFWGIWSSMSTLMMRYNVNPYEVKCQPI